MEKIIFLLMLALGLSACSTNKAAAVEDENRKFHTAKINAQLGMAYLERHEIQHAKQKLLLALEEGPSLPETWYSMAYFYEVTGNEVEAREHYLKAIAVSPARGEAQNNYGTFLCRSGHYQEAIQHFMLAVHDSSYLNPGAAYENAGLCAMKIPNDVQARVYFRNAVLQDPNRKISLAKLTELNAKLKTPQSIV